MISNGSCTVFNRVYNKETRLDNWQACPIHGVLWEGKDGCEPMKGGMKKENNATVYIPFLSGTEGKAYKSPTDFNKNPAGAFTLRPGDKLARGIANAVEGEPEGLTITGVETFDYGSRDMRHWEVYLQ